MALMITDECILCGICEPECPNEAISRREDTFHIRSGCCTECVGHYAKPRCRSLCPVPECIVLNPMRVESPEVLLKKYQQLEIRRRISSAMVFLDK